MVYGDQYMPHSIMSFVEDLKKTKLTGLVDLIHDRSEEFDKYVAEEGRSVET